MTESQQKGHSVWISALTIYHRLLDENECKPVENNNIETQTDHTNTIFPEVKGLRQESTTGFLWQFRLLHHRKKLVMKEMISREYWISMATEDNKLYSDMLTDFPSRNQNSGKGYQCDMWRGVAYTTTIRRLVHLKKYFRLQI